MDYPNLHRKLFKGGAAAYTRLWTRKTSGRRKLPEIEVGVIAVLHQGSLEAGPENFIAILPRNSGSKQLSGEYPFSRWSCRGS